MNAHRPDHRPFRHAAARVRAGLRATIGGAAVAVAGAGGCVERELVAESQPVGALVRMNDQEMGRTPAARGFQWYGTYDAVVQAEGYETLRARTPVIAPVWQWVPFDLLAEVLPITFRDVRTVRYELKPLTDETADPKQVVARAGGLRAQLESGLLTTTRPAAPAAGAAMPAAAKANATRAAGG